MARMHIWRIRSAQVAASTESRRAKSGWISPSGRVPVPWVAIRKRSADAAVHEQKGPEDRVDQDRSAGVRTDGLFQGPGIRLAGLPDLGQLVLLAQRIPERGTPPGGLAELLGQLAQEALGVEVAPGAPDLALQYGWIGEVLEQRHDVGEGLVEGVHVGVDRLVEPRMHPVQEGVGD